ncbi:hypothetical protein PB1_02735 [Bacillus methanolicus PB1]|uniref:Uncharacterized protein n=1 Tax=Bacillus methanolicus PB1 TaxID=997296 RepID=I3E5P9_BACMT|nr:hypothetical protein [Bacillus methanolicus]EIJ81820.1 hypothetical protein PB1_02735 [Bacillus methanolicus PB1]
MGYILPAGHDQYYQYAIRELGNSGHSIQFMPIARINREGTGIIPYQAFSAYKKVFTQKEIAPSIKNNIIRKTIEKTYAEVTGKGKYFCERI